MPNVYDVLYERPRLHRRLKAPAEKLARAIIASGRLRLDADNESNFIRLQSPTDRLNLTFTLRETTDPKLQAASLARIVTALAVIHTPEEAKKRSLSYMEKVKSDLKRKSPVAAKTELMVSRALVSCNAFPVIRLLHLEGAELYVSFGHSVSDVLDVATWQEVGENNGLQAFGKGQNAVYISCGGHPFLSDAERSYTTDGFPALARFFVVGAQETGHNADMVRGPDNQWSGRHSALNWGSTPSPKAGKARKNDASVTANFQHKSRRLGLNLIAEWERHLQFYRQNKLRNLRSTGAWLKSRLGWQCYKLLLRLRGMRRLCHLQHSPSPATQLRTCLQDMAFNLTPDHEAYHRSDPAAHEAMLCMEALARVPQQVVKWGHSTTAACMPGLYRLYYNEVVTACAAAIERRTARG